ncbi:MAG: YggS family pyridoxal phosphate-dependent enzyme [bacterium]
MSIKENLEIIKNRIKQVVKDPSEIELVAVTKSAGVNQIIEAINSGITNIGENRIQEAKGKFDQLKKMEIKWHMIGHLQRNKVKEAIKIFDMIQSVDRLELAKEIEEQAGQINKIMDVLIEVNVSNEETKFGVSPVATLELIQEIAKLNNIRIKGLMTIAPLVLNPEDTRPYFRALVNLRDEIVHQQIENVEMKYLSMGMSNDFEVALEEGANMIRIGRAIFCKSSYSATEGHR